MSPFLRRSLASRLVPLLTAIAVLHGAAAAAWAAPIGESRQPQHHCVMSGMDCERASMVCCSTPDPQPQSTPPPSSSIAGKIAPHAVHLMVAMVPAAASHLVDSGACYARPPTHGYSSRAIHVLQSVLLV